MNVETNQRQTQKTVQTVVMVLRASMGAKLAFVNVTIKRENKTMTKQRAIELIGDRAKWELQHMKKALSMLGALNTPEENERLEAVKTLLRK